MAYLYIVQLLILGFLAYEDWRAQKISLLGILLFTSITVSSLLFLGFPIPYDLVGCTLAFLGSLNLISRFGRGKSLMGAGDLFLLIPLVMTLNPMDLPLFFITAGGIGLLTSWVLKSKKFPFVPALTGAYALVLINRLGVSYG